MDNSSDEKVNLTGVLNYLQSAYPSGQDTPYLFINPGGNLETFFNYKGLLIELNKFSLELSMNKKSVDQVGKEIREMIVNGLKIGDWIVFSTGNMILGFEDFLKQFSFFDADFLKNSKIADKKFLTSKGILKKEEDFDFNGNKGFYKVNENAKILYLSAIEVKDLQNCKNKNSSKTFKYVLVE